MSDPAPAATDRFAAELRRHEFSRLDRQGIAYLDYAGAALYAESQLRASFALLAREVFGNPHSESRPSRRSTAVVEEARDMALRFLDADPAEYVVVFTANSSAAVKLVAESYPFKPRTTLALSADNHNSVNGIREFARRGAARVQYLPLDRELRLQDPAEWLARERRGCQRLFAFPAQSNFSGVRHPLSLIADAHALGYDVLLDAAAYVPSSRLSLREHPADFVVLSFYKIFGCPTGVGALVARRSVLSRLRRPWFAGGTVAYASVQNGRHELRPMAEGFEDGTPSFLGIAALAAGFAFLEQVGMQRLAAHVGALGASLLEGLTSLAHGDGSPVVCIHGPRDGRDRGATIAFNVLTREGQPIRYTAVEERARELGLAVRGGCFCNPGASEAAFGFDSGAADRCLDLVGGAGFTIERFAHCMGANVAVGAVRASLGLANDEHDVRRAIELVASFRE